MNKQKEIIECDKFIKEFILRARNFIESSCYQYGKYKYAITHEPDADFISDFQYFVFTKSTKSLESIKALLKIGHTEDVFILARTMLEGYLASRYIAEKYDDSFVRDFIITPQLITQRKIIYEKGEARIRETNEIIEYLQRNPSEMKLGKDRKYFVDLYDFLCKFAHCNFSTLYYYIDNNDRYTCDNITNAYIARIIVLFIYTKLFENIVTVEGEDFLSEKEEEKCYKLVENSTKFLYEQLEYFSKFNSKNVGSELNKHMRAMFKDMKKSLTEGLGSVNKDFLR